MKKIDDKILDIDNAICKNINQFGNSDRGFLSQNILSQLRNFVEHISLKIYANGQDIDNSYSNIEKANEYVKSRGNLKFLSKLHRLLQISASHYTLDEENSERLMLKYYEYLIRIKDFLKNTYNIEVLNNIEDFPISIDPNLKEYYEKIAEKINHSTTIETDNTYKDRYYIQKIKPFFVDQKIYYEVTFTIADDRISKFDRIIAFTKIDISPCYAVRLSIKNDSINILCKDMPILIINGWEVNIRPCEINNFSKIFGKDINISRASLEYRMLMKFLTTTGLNLAEFIKFNDEYYLKIRNQVILKIKTPKFFDILDRCRELVKENSPGSNVILYLLYRLNNKIIKKQYKNKYWDYMNREYRYKGCGYLSDLYLDYKCIPFDKIPFNTSLVNHNPKISDLFNCLDFLNREHEIFARFIKNNIEIEGQLYTPKKGIVDFSNIDDLIQNYNSNLYDKHTHRQLDVYKGNIYIRGYEDDTLYIIKRIKELTESGVENYSNSVDYWLQSSTYYIDCDEKKGILREMFEDSKVGLIYGAAGTGKSTLINHISNFFNDKEKLYLATTNPAVDNLKRVTNAANCTFKTIAKFTHNNNLDTEYDILIIDECSTVSNKDMVSILKKASFRLLVLVGDIYQIESIIFGNWFSMAREFVSESAISVLTKPYRSKSEKLLTLWDRVRNMDDAILETLTKNNYSTTLDESIFEFTEEDEIILCLNYDGLYGINNINRFLQGNNKNEPIQWGVQVYKINDPILFNESERFAPLIYNNLKGRIVDIKKYEDKIQFDIEIYKSVNELDVERYDFEFIGNSDNGNSVIRFSVNEIGNTDEDDNLSSESVVPFQVAYAVSIHKAQGLEYNSVKIVITDEVEERITHNIFYTAITRAKEKLKIYWTPETENKILSNFTIRNSRRDIALLSTKFDL